MTVARLCVSTRFVSHDPLSLPPQYFVFDFFAHKEVFFDKVIKLTVSESLEWSYVLRWRGFHDGALSVPAR